MVITSSFDFDRSGDERRFTFQRLCLDRSSRSFSAPVAVSFAQPTPRIRSIGKANLWRSSFRRHHPTSSSSSLSRTTPINSFQTTTDYLAFHRTEANAYRRQSGDNLWLRNRESVSAPSRFFLPSAHGSGDPSDRRFRGSHVVVESVQNVRGFINILRWNHVPRTLRIYCSKIVMFP